MKNLNEMFLVAKCKGSSWFRRARSKFPCFFTRNVQVFGRLLWPEMSVSKWNGKCWCYRVGTSTGGLFWGLRIFRPPSFCPRVAREMSIRPDMIRSYFVSSADSFVCSRNIWHFCRFFAPHTTRPPFTFRRVFPVSGATCAERRTEFASSFPSPSFFPPFGLKFRVFVSNQPWMRRHVCAVLALCLDEWHEMNEMYKIRWRQPLGWGKYRMIGITIYTRRNAIYSAHHCHLVIHSNRFVSKFTAFFVSSLKELCQKDFFSSIIFSNAPAPGDLSLGFQLLNICSRRGECFLGKTFGFARTVRSLKSFQFRLRLPC